MQGRVVWTLLSASLVMSLLGGSVGCAPAETGCVLSGGTVDTATCCESVDDFPDTCATGACGCSPDDSHEVAVCDCGEGSCFNGLVCVPSD